MKLTQIITNYVAPVVAIGVFGLGMRFGIGNYCKDGLREIDQLDSLIHNSPRIAYTVKKGDNLDSLQHRFFPISDNEFTHINELHQNWINGARDYRELLTKNIYENTLRKENFGWKADFVYPYKSGQRLNIPARK